MNLQQHSQENNFTSAKLSAPLEKVREWFRTRGWQPFRFQEDVWENYAAGRSGLLNAPTGSGKTYALWMAPLIEWLGENTGRENVIPLKKSGGLRVLWITPLRALAKDIQRAQQEACDQLGIPWTVALRTGDVAAGKRRRQLKDMPEAMITTPESLHILLAQKNYPDIFRSLRLIVVDEWHELLGTKRGTMVEMALSRIGKFAPDMRVWGISATIGNLEQARDVLTASRPGPVIVRSEIRKDISIETLIPANLERFSWAGHVGTQMLPAVSEIIDKSRSSLIFTNARSQTEVWYQNLLEYNPGLAGQMAIHHGSVDAKIRGWVENALHEGILKAVVCTSSLDLGVDFSPVETVLQVGSPKGVARFLQRAGRSGHRPGAVSRMYFVPTNTLELVEGAVLREAAEKNMVESRTPVSKPLDLLTQYLVTLAVSDGFYPDEIFGELKSTFAYAELAREEFDWVLDFITTGGNALYAYDEYRKVELCEDGSYMVRDQAIARRHKMSIGTIMSDASLRVKYLKGGDLGSIEEKFISRIEPGDNFWFAGRNLELVRIKDMTVYVRRGKGDSGVVPNWLGNRLPLSANMAALLRKKIAEAKHGRSADPELRALKPVFDVQRRWSQMPGEDELLIEQIKTREGYHIFIYPFEGRVGHEGLAALAAHRIAERKGLSFSIAMNDYGFELVSDTEVDPEILLDGKLFSPENFLQDLFAAINSSEMAKRSFREIARISGLVFNGFPGREKLSRHLQASAEMIFEVFSKYDGDNLLLSQAFGELLEYQLEEKRLLGALERISGQKILYERPERLTPFAFPIYVDRLRERVGSSRVKERIEKMQLQLETAAERDLKKRR